MWKLIGDLDRVLRGEATRPEMLRTGQLDTPAGGLSIAITVLGLIYGACMGTFALFRAGDASYLQWLATTLKVPALFWLTLVVTFPSLYVFNALVGSRLMLGSVFRLLVASLGVNLAVLASLGPIVAFFSVSTTSYHFMVLLNVVIFAVAGLLGLAFLLQTLHRMSMAGAAPRPDDELPLTPVIVEPGERAQAELPAAALPAERVGPLDRLQGHVLSRHVKTVFRCWMVVFGLVGAQMAWVLRPFVGDPTIEFQWFRERDSNFFEAVWQALRALFSAS